MSEEPSGRADARAVEPANIKRLADYGTWEAAAGTASLERSRITELYRLMVMIHMNGCRNK